MSEVTDWISAGANVAAAIGTVGALWVGAWTLRRQVDDQHRAQARLVTVAIKRVRRWRKSEDVLYVLNNSDEPIFGVSLLITTHEGTAATREDVLSPKASMSAVSKPGTVAEASANFGDSSGNGWTRLISGELLADRNWGRQSLDAPKARAEQAKRLRGIERGIEKVRRNEQPMPGES